MSDDAGSATTATFPHPAIAAVVATRPAGLAPGADPDEVRDWFELETIVGLPVPAASLAEAEAAEAEAAPAEYRRAARAENTRRAYRAAVAAFTDWCATHGQIALPASPETVAAFLAADAGRGLAVNTLRLRHAGLRYLHLLAGTALETWLAAAEIVEGPLFRRLWRPPPPLVRKGVKRKPVADRYRIGTNPIDTDSIALVVKKWTGLAGLDGAAFAGHSLRRGAISSGVAQGVHIARL
ncbi:MAG TPA: site-specific integrase, partial [Stellaceae bacterium]